jgi:D-glycero-alpha-D-manno-heptose-7-phosphate kinase
VEDSSLITGRAWCRVDLAGGTLDIWPLGILHEGSRTVNLAISLPVRVTIAASTGPYQVEQGGSLVRAADPSELCGQSETALIGLVCTELELPAVKITIESASPRGGGLGASSALTVALLSAGLRFLGRSADAPDQIVSLGRDIEARLMGLPTGVQDHYPASAGCGPRAARQAHAGRVLWQEPLLCG